MKLKIIINGGFTMANGLFGGGDGTELSPYLIEDGQDINAINALLSTYPFQHFKMVNDIDMTGIDFKIIGDTSQGPPMMGVFDGNGHTLSGINITKDPGSYASSFAVFDRISGDQAILKNLTVKDITISTDSDDKVALLVANVSEGAIVDNCYGEGIIQARQAFVGGISVFVDSSTIKNSSVKIKAEAHKAGGVVYSSSKCIIENCSASGEISGHNDYSKISPFILVSNYASVLKNIVSTVSVSNKYEGEGDYSKIYPFCQEVSEETILENNFVAIAGLLYPEWSEFKAYYSDDIITGTDGEFYICTAYQMAENPLFRPIDGDDWWKYWYPHEIENALSNTQLRNKNNFVNWDFENVWIMGANGPELKAFYVPIEDSPGGGGDGGDDTPSDIVIVTDVDFTKTEMMHDISGRAIPQVWDHENNRFVPVTLQMIELMIKR